MKKYITLEHHPQDSRIKIVDSEICQTLASNMGLGGNNVPLILVFDMLNLNPKTDNLCQTLNAYNGTGGNNMPLLLIEKNEADNPNGKEIL